LVWLSTLLVSLTASAQEASGPEALKATLEEHLLQPLARRDSERSRFSRVWEPPLERRVRLIDPALQQDARGLPYVTFAVDARASAGAWMQNAIVGCIYPRDGAIYVKRGDTYRAAAFLLGKKTEAPPEGVCRGRSSS
jgi:hypothetical protein